MTFRQFTALATVAKHMNITKAAQALRISQPSLSKHLKLLEETYNLRLFSRNGNGIRLTDDGLEFLTHIDPILAQLKNLEDRYLRNSRKNRVVPLRVGGTYVVASGILPSLLAGLKKSYPNVDVVLRSDKTSVLEQMMLKGELEIAVSSLLPRSSELTAEAYVGLKVVAFAAKTYPIPRKQLNLADLEKIPLIVRANGNQRGPTAVLLQRLAAEGYRPNIVMRCDSPEGIKAAVNNKLGVGILYHEVLKDEIARGVFKEVHVSGLQTQRETYIFYLKERPLSPSAEIFLKLLRQSRDRQVKSETTETDSFRPLPVC
jgi:LysR family transcriptional regulator, transcriptional activator of the cysJI operon